ncbi:hypothetical protein QYF36_015884 [Acer negundo]|nr:hypothetical protein QYF36_015884 [Acer negundo]
MEHFKLSPRVGDVYFLVPTMQTIEPNMDGLVTGFLFSLNALTTNGLPMILKLIYGTRSLKFQRLIVTGNILDFHFDPFKKHWTTVASMLTPRSHFACSVISGKVYVAGGRNSSSSNGLKLAEVYDPLTDRWEELPPMRHPQMDCLGLSYKGKLHVLNDLVGLADRNRSEVFNPLNSTWCIVEDTWPFSRAMQFSVQVIGDAQVYTVVDWGESLIKTRDNEKGDWYNVGSVPSIILSDHYRPVEAFGYGFAALKNKLYVLGGTALRWEDSRGGRFDIRRMCILGRINFFMIKAVLLNEAKQRRLEECLKWNNAGFDVCEVKK